MQVMTQVMTPKPKQALWIETRVATPKDIKELCMVEGDCLTFFLPAHQGGSGTQPTATRLRILLDEAERELEHRGVKQGSRHALLDPIWALTSDPDMFSGHKDGLAIFRGARTLELFRLPVQVEERFEYAGRFLVTPLLEELEKEPAFFVLELTKKGVRLIRAEEGNFEQLPLPDDCPPAFELADLTGEHKPEPSPRINSAREQYMKYLRLVDRSLRRILRPAGFPLVLAGVQEDVTLFRSVCSYSAVVEESVALSPERFLESEVVAKAHEALSRWLGPEQRKAIEEFASGRRPVSAELNLIVAAAAEGRIQSLLMTPGASCIGDFGHIVSRFSGEGMTDLVNAAAVETVRHSGQVIVLPSGKMPAKVTVAAILRY